MKSIREIWLNILENLFKVQLRSYALKVGDEILYFEPKEIIRIEADSNYSILHTTSKVHLISKSLFQIEGILLMVGGLFG